MVNDIIKGMGIMCLFGLLMLLIFSRFYDGPVIVTVDNNNYNYRHILNEIQSINTKIDDVNTTQINNNQVTYNDYSFVQERNPSNYCHDKYKIDFIYDVTGKSMLPTIGQNDVAMGVKYTNRKTLVPGDIVAYRVSDDEIWVHRVIAVYHTYVVLKGDNNPFADEWHVTYDKIEHVICEIHFK